MKRRVKSYEYKLLEELEKEYKNISRINFSAFLIVLYRYYGYREKRLKKIFKECIDVFFECFGQDKSMVQMCEEETGIELQCGDGKSWRDLEYLNTEKWDHLIPSKEKMIAVRIAQKKWMEPNVNASILIAMHRLYGFGYERLCKLYEELLDVVYEYGKDQKTIVKAAEEQTGINVVDYLESKRSEI